MEDTRSSEDRLEIRGERLKEIRRSEVRVEIRGKKIRFWSWYTD